MERGTTELPAGLKTLILCSVGVVGVLGPRKKALTLCGG